jgi:outer membrane lipoprotein carrier protein
MKCESSNRQRKASAGKNRNPACVLLCVVLMCAGAGAQKALRDDTERTTNQLIEQIEARYGRMRGLAAEFEQKYSAPGARERRERGRLVLQRPRRMRWEYDPKPGKLFIVNGRDVWLYIPSDREATHADLNSVSDARFPFLFLLGQTNLRREFRSITLMESNQQGETLTLRLVPRAASAGLREIFLEVYADGRITKVTLVDNSGAVSEVALSNVRENFIAPVDAFEFRPPPGVTVRRQK